MKRSLLILLLTVFSISAFSVEVTFKVNMEESGMTYDSVFIVGTINEWQFTPLENESGEIYSVTLDLNAGDTAVYYFITQSSWDNYEDFREPVIPNECGDSTLAGWSGDRVLEVPDEPTEAAYMWGTCETIEDSNPTNVENSQIANTLHIYPNPSVGELNLDLSSFSSMVSVEIYNLTGKLEISYENLNNQLETIRPELQSGLYLLKVYDGTRELHQKVMIE